MSSDYSNIRKLLVAQLVVGAMMLFWGIFIVSVRPYLLLDVVLSPAELRDAKKHDETLALLKKANANDRAAWIVAAAFVAGSGAVGLRLIAAPRNRGLYVPESVVVVAHPETGDAVDPLTRIVAHNVSGDNFPATTITSARRD